MLDEPEGMGNSAFQKWLDIGLSGSSISIDSFNTHGYSIKVYISQIKRQINSLSAKKEVLKLGLNPIPWAQIQSG